MQPTPLLAPHRTAAWLNGRAWALLGLCLLLFLSLRGTVNWVALWAFFGGLAVTGLGSVVNLVLCVRCFARGHWQQALAYLAGLLALVLPFYALCWALAEATRFDE